MRLSAVAKADGGRHVGVDRDGDECQSAMICRRRGSSAADAWAQPQNRGVGDDRRPHRAQHGAAESARR